MESTASSSSSVSRLRWWQVLGPDFVIAATGVETGDLIAAAVSGSRYGLAALWAVALGALFKWVLNEGVSRWQLATGTTVIEGWIERLPRVVTWYFAGYLVLWSFLVAAALASACGVAAHAIVPAIPVKAWGALHATAGFVLVWRGGYAVFEQVMKALVAAMFVVVVVCAVLLRPDPAEFARGLFVPAIPQGSARFLLGVIGGVGGSVTLLCYGYWIRERGWSGAAAHRRSLIDLTCAYALTGLFGLGMIVIAAEAGPGAATTGNALVRALADRLGAMLGPAGRACFLVGFWCAVATSLLGVWQGVPYLFADTLAVLRRKSATPAAPVGTSSTPAGLSRTPVYRWYLAYLAFPPLSLLLLERPLLIVVVYAIAGAFFMPFLATILLVMNNRRNWVGALRNPWPINVLLALSLVLFAWLCVDEAHANLQQFFSS